MAEYPNKGKAWSKADDARLLELKGAKAANDVLETAFGRPITAITARYRMLVNAAAAAAAPANAEETETTDENIRTFTVGYCKFVEC